MWTVLFSCTSDQRQTRRFGNILEKFFFFLVMDYWKRHSRSESQPLRGFMLDPRAASSTDIIGRSVNQWLGATLPSFSPSLFLSLSFSFSWLLLLLGGQFMISFSRPNHICMIILYLDNNNSRKRFEWEIPTYHKNNSTLQFLWGRKIIAFCYILQLAPWTSLSPRISSICLFISFWPSTSTWRSRMTKTGQHPGVTASSIASYTKENDTRLLRVYPRVTILCFEGQTSISELVLLNEMKNHLEINAPTKRHDEADEDTGVLRICRSMS